MNNGLRSILLLILFTGMTLSCNRESVQPLYNVNSSQKEDDKTTAFLRDLEKINLQPAQLKRLLNLPIDLNLPELVYNHKITRIDSLIDHAFQYQGFNGAVLVGEKGHILLEKSVGFSNFSTGEKLTNESIFQLASVSKQFTAMSIMMLKQQGLISYDDDMTKYLPELPYKGITIRHLLNHTSGLPNYMWLVDNRWKGEGAPYNEEVIALMAKYKPQVYFKPGAKFTYSNTGYMLLASIVERVSGEDFIDYVDKQIFQPLGMTNSFVYSSARDCNYKECVPGYKMARRGLYKVGTDELDGAVGDKGVHSTIGDMYKWDQALYSDRLVSAEILAEAFQKGKTNTNKDVNYGFGFRITERNGKKIIYHNGLWNGFRTAIIRDVESEITIIVLNHTNSPAKHIVVNGIEKILNGTDTPFMELPEPDPDHTLMGEE